jgi:general secretion pathway protein A
VIGVFKKKADLPEYLAHYGMHRPPFSETPEDDMYYSEPTRKQRLDILLHLTQYTHELLVVTGEKGMGKTMFMREFINNAGDHWKICQIDSHPMMTDEQFLQRVNMGYGISTTGNNKLSMLSGLKKHLDGLLQQALPVILLIDDAHLFPTHILRLILEIAALKNPISNCSVRVILFSEPQIKITLAEPELDQKHKLIVRKIDLPPLNEAHTGYYLQHRLSQAGMHVEQFLTKPTIAKIYKRSHGIPQKINEAADKLLFETTPIIRRTSHVAAQQKKMAGSKYMVMTMVVLAMAGLYGVHYFFKDKDRGKQTHVVNENSEQTVKPVKLPPLAKDKVPDRDNKSTPAKATDTTDTIGASQSQPVVVAAKTSEQPHAQMATQTPAATPNEDDQKSTLSLPATESRLKDANWIMRQDANNYTLQLVTGHRQSTIENFIKKYRLDNQELSYYYSRRNGKGWHNLTYGIYPDRQTANNAIDLLPSGLAKEKPWIRQMRTIQSEIVQSQ